MAKRPTEAELKTLYQNKGHDAVVWYMWRNAVRSLVALGQGHLQEVWKDQTAQHVYAVCRVSMILAQWADPDIARATIRVAARTAAKAAASVAQDTFDAHCNTGFGNHFSDLTAIDAAEETANAAADAAAYASLAAVDTDIYADTDATGADTTDTDTTDTDTTDADTTDADTTDIGIDSDTDGDTTDPGVDTPAVTAAADAAEITYGAPEAAADATNAACADYIFLCRYQGPIDQGFWRSRPLWEEGVLGLGGGPEWFKQWRDMLVKQLSQLGLGFLAADLNTLWHGQPLSPRAENYLKNLSETVTNDLGLLRRAIRGEAVRHVHAVRVLLLGPGGAGKSSLADRLQGNPVETVKRMTPGIEQHRPLELRKTFPGYGLNDKKLDLFLWDFGGQTIFHGLHSAFLHENCVYVLVVDSRHEQAPDEWLYQIRHLAGSRASVLLVTNWYEQCESRQNRVRLLREFPDLLQADSFFYFSCLNKDAPEFEAYVRALLQSSLDSQKMVLKETLDVQRELEQIYQNTVFLKEDQLRSLIDRTIRRKGEAESTLSQLEQLGFLVRVNKGSNHYCLKPSWAVDNAYQILYSRELRDNDGVLPLSKLEQVFKGMPENHLEYLVRFLQDRHLCRQLEELGGDYFFPDATNADEPAEVSQLLGQEVKLSLHFDLPYLPLGFHARLVHRLFAPDNDVGIRLPRDIWRQGFILRGRHSHAVVQYQLRKSVIEMNLTGNLQEFASLLDVFYVNMKAVMASSNGIKEEQIYTSVLYNQQLFSVRSGKDLIDVLGGIKSFNEIIRRVGDMAARINVTGNEAPVIIGDQNRYQSPNITITVSADQRQIINSLLDEMLRHEIDFSDNVLEAFTVIQQALKADAEKPTEKTQSMLGRVWNGLKELTGFTAHAADITEFVLGHKDAIAGVLAAAAGLLA